MPVQKCQVDGKSGFKWGASGKCYTHDGSDAGKKRAKKLAVKQAIAIGGGKMPTDRKNELDAEGLSLLAEAERELEELETEDLTGVEILSTGGPVKGIGSPPEGDYWTADDLRAMADAAAELGDEIRAPSKIGHSETQALAGVTDGELPAVGWLDNLRVNDDGTRLLADVKKVPKKVAGLIRAGAYRARSVELSKVTSQKTEKTYDWVVTGLAWLGGKLPAVRTLDDVVALYEDAGLEKPGEPKVFVVYATGDIVWDPGQSFRAIQNDLSEALNGPGPQMGPPRYWVRDVSADGKALVCEGYDDEDAWVVAWSKDADGTVTVAPSSDWVKAEQTWVETAKSYASRDSRGRVDSRPMPDEKYSADQRRKFAEATGLEADKVTDEMLAKAGIAEDTPEPVVSDDKARELAEALGVEVKDGDTLDPAKLLEAAKAKPKERQLQLEGEQMRALESRLNEEADARKKLETRLYEQERDHFIETEALKTGKIEPGQREFIQVMYDADPEKARKYVESMPVQEHLVREYGTDDDGSDPEKKRELEDKDYGDYATAHLGLDKDEVI